MPRIHEEIIPFDLAQDKSGETLAPTKKVKIVVKLLTHEYPPEYYTNMENPLAQPLDIQKLVTEGSVKALKMQQSEGKLDLANSGVQNLIINTINSIRGIPLDGLEAANKEIKKEAEGQNLTPAHLLAQKTLIDVVTGELPLDEKQREMITSLSRLFITPPTA